jgi:hypothetical protein
VNVLYEREAAAVRGVARGRARGLARLRIDGVDQPLGHGPLALEYTAAVPLPSGCDQLADVLTERAVLGSRHVAGRTTGRYAEVPGWADPARLSAARS